MDLITPKDLLNANKYLKKYGGTGFANVLMRILKLNKINQEYSKFSDKYGIDFINSLISDLELKYEVNEEEIKRIPENGAFILISNHPFGGIEAILTIKIISLIRPDFKYLANFLLTKIDTLKDYFIPINPFETLKESNSSLTGLKCAYNQLKEGNCLGIFPAGEV